jgi:hypothetical protein
MKEFTEKDFTAALDAAKLARSQRSGGMPSEDFVVIPVCAPGKYNGSLFPRWLIASESVTKFAPFGGLRKFFKTKNFEGYNTLDETGAPVVSEDISDIESLTELIGKVITNSDTRKDVAVRRYDGTYPAEMSEAVRTFLVLDDQETYNVMRTAALEWAAEQGYTEEVTLSQEALPELWETPEQEPVKLTPAQKAAAARAAAKAKASK